MTTHTLTEITFDREVDAVNDTGTSSSGPNWWPREYVVLETLKDDGSRGVFVVYQAHGIRVGSFTTTLTDLSRQPEEGDYFMATVDGETVVSIRFSQTLTKRISELQGFLDGDDSGNN